MSRCWQWQMWSLQLPRRQATQATTGPPSSSCAEVAAGSTPGRAMGGHPRRSAPVQCTKLLLLQWHMMTQVTCSGAVLLIQVTCNGAALLCRVRPLSGGDKADAAPVLCMLCCSSVARHLPGVPPMP